MGSDKSSLKIEDDKDYQARLLTPFAVLGIRTEEDWLTGIDYLPRDIPEKIPQNVSPSFTIR